MICCARARRHSGDPSSFCSISSRSTSSITRTRSGITFDSEFARAVNREDVDAGFLIAIREDALSKLDRFRARIPSLLGNTLRLQHLGAADAEAAIRKPLDVFNARASEGASPVLIEDELVRSVLLQVRTGQVSLGQSAGVGQAQTGEETTRIEAPFLQLVMTRLWEEERKAHSHTLRASTLQRLGGAQQIVASHLDSVMAKLDAVEQEVCSRFFDRLVTPSGSKIACGADDLTKWAGDLASHVPAVLQTLSDRRLLRGVAGPADRPQAQRFEIFHDVLAPAVLAWRTRYIEARERAEAERRTEEQRRRAEEQAKVAKRLRRLSLALLAVVVLAIGAASYAWVQRDEAERQRGQAESQSRLATARYLVGETRLHLHDQLDLALLLGLEASRRADTDEVRNSLVDALAHQSLAHCVPARQPRVRERGLQPGRQDPGNGRSGFSGGGSRDSLGRENAPPARPASRPGERRVGRGPEPGRNDLGVGRLREDRGQCMQRRERSVSGTWRVMSLPDNRSRAIRT